MRLLCASSMIPRTWTRCTGWAWTATFLYLGSTPRSRSTPSRPSTRRCSTCGAPLRYPWSSWATRPTWTSIGASSSVGGYGDASQCLGERDGPTAVVVGGCRSCADKSLRRRQQHSRPSGAVRLLSARPRRATISVRHLLMVRARALFAGLTIVCMCLYVCVCGVDVIFDKLLEQIEKSGRAPPAPSKSGDCSLL